MRSGEQDDDDRGAMTRFITWLKWDLRAYGIEIGVMKRKIKWLASVLTGMLISLSSFKLIIDLSARALDFGCSFLSYFGAKRPISSQFTRSQIYGTRWDWSLTFKTLEKFTDLFTAKKPTAATLCAQILIVQVIKAHTIWFLQRARSSGFFVVVPPSNDDYHKIIFQSEGQLQSTIGCTV